MSLIIDFTRKFKNNVIISLLDISKEFLKFDSRRLVEWQRQGYIKRVIRGFYIFTDLKRDENISCIIANKIYDPSYVSLESALRYYNLIPEQVTTTTSISTKKTKKFKTEVGIFSYRNIKKELFFGYNLINYKEHVIKMASPEKAILDYIYYRPYLKTEYDFKELRLNEEVLKNEVDKNKIREYLLKYSNKTFIKTINNFLKFISND